MRLSGLPSCHLGYCTNIHPAHSWAEVRAALARHVPAVRDRLGAASPFGVGLRLSARAARELDAPRARAELHALLEDHGLYVFTLNGFPFGAFHDTRVKEAVYEPDWRSAERLEYSNRLAALMAELAPAADMQGSVSTVPGAFRPNAVAPARVALIAEHMLRHAAELWRIHQRSGAQVALALEPEPECLLETVTDAIVFLEAHLLDSGGVGRMAALTGLDRASAEAALRTHLGVCVDVCHAAVEYEDPVAAFTALRARGIAVPKVQLSAALRIAPIEPAALDRLWAFNDGVYLHQVVARQGEELRRYPDLPQALIAHAQGATADEWRVHFHVPVFLERLDDFSSTQPDLVAALDYLRDDPLAPHLEVETYTWGVLPEHHRAPGVDAAIARELDWARRRLAP